MDAAATHSIPTQTILAAYTEIGHCVNTALRTQVGDAAHLGEQRRECLRLLILVGQVSLCIQLISILSLFISMWISSLLMSMQLSITVSIK
jgi:hypothetical protein